MSKKQRKKQKFALIKARYVQVRTDILYLQRIIIDLKSNIGKQRHANIDKKTIKHENNDTTSSNLIQTRLTFLQHHRFIIHIE